MQVAPDAVILAGGQGSRLRAILRGQPKPLAPVAGRPFLGWLLRSLQQQGIRRVVLSTGCGAPQIDEFVEQERRAGDLRLEMLCVSESKPLGTGGGLRNTLAEIRTSQLVVLNGDSHFPFDLDGLMCHHRSRNARATVLLARVADASRFGSVEIDSEGRITAFREKVHGAGPGLVNAGVYLLEREAAEEIAGGVEVSLEREVFPRWIDAGLYGLVSAGSLIDIGTPESYAAAQSRPEWEALARAVAS